MASRMENIVMSQRGNERSNVCVSVRPRTRAKTSKEAARFLR